MKKYNILFLLVTLLSLTSCLKSNMEDLPEFEEKEITGVQKVEYRYVSSEISGASGQPIVKYVTLNKEAVIDKESASVKIKVTVPAASTAFPAAEREKCSKSNVAVMVSLSTAARIAPTGGAPKLGVPGDWSKANKYIVTAADGSKKEWTIEITEFIK